MRKILVLASCLIYIAGFAQNTDKFALKYAQTIDKAEMKSFLSRLASDEFEGRETGRKGQVQAASFIAARWKSDGIKPGFEGSYFQPYAIYENLLDQPTLSFDGTQLSFLKDFIVFPTSGEGETSTDSVSIFSIKDLDNEIRDLSQQIAVLHLPDTGITNIILSKWIRKLAEAKPKAIICSTDSLQKMIGMYSHYLDRGRMSLNPPSTGKAAFKLPMVVLTSNKFLPPNNKTYYWPTQLQIKKKWNPISASNVVGIIEGSDLKDEFVVLSAHYDHLGVSDGKVYYGADDDGSGTTAITEIAQAFAKAKKEGHGPRRSIIVLGFSGEEKGLLGSSYYSEHPVKELAKTVVDLNIDMIGRVDKDHENDKPYVYIIGSDKLSSGLHEINENSNKSYSHIELDYTYNKPEDPNRFYYRSDHYNFAKNKVPVIFYFTGVHADYHKPSDTVDKILFDRMEVITRQVFYTAWELANRSDRIKVDKVSDFKNDK